MPLVCFVTLQENVQRELMEKKQAEREHQKAEKEKLKQDSSKKNSSTGKIPEPQEDIVDSLLKEIRAGTTLRSRGAGTVKRRKCTLKKEDMEKLELMAKQDKKPENGEMIVEDVEQKMNGHT